MFDLSSPPEETPNVEYALTKRHAPIMCIDSLEPSYLSPWATPFLLKTLTHPLSSGGSSWATQLKPLNTPSGGTGIFSICTNSSTSGYIWTLRRICFVPRLAFTATFIPSKLSQDKYPANKVAPWRIPNRVNTPLRVKRRSLKNSSP